MLSLNSFLCVTILTVKIADPQTLKVRASSSIERQYLNKETTDFTKLCEIYIRL